MYKVKDNAESQLQFGISSVATTLVVKEGQGAKFPEVPFLVVLNKRNSDWEITKSEKVEVSSVNGDQFTISRGYEWTTPSDFSADDFVSLFVLARHIEELQTEVAKKADQTDVQSVAQRADSLEEKLSTAEENILSLKGKQASSFKWVYFCFESIKSGEGLGYIREIKPENCNNFFYVWLNTFWIKRRFYTFISDVNLSNITLKLGYNWTLQYDLKLRFLDEETFEKIHPEAEFTFNFSKMNNPNGQLITSEDKQSFMIDEKYLNKRVIAELDMSWMLHTINYWKVYRYINNASEFYIPIYNNIAYCKKESWDQMRNDWFIISGHTDFFVNKSWTLCACMKGKSSGYWTNRIEYPLNLQWDFDIEIYATCALWGYNGGYSIWWSQWWWMWIKTSNGSAWLLYCDPKNKQITTSIWGSLAVPQMTLGDTEPRIFRFKREWSKLKCWYERIYLWEINCSTENTWKFEQSRDFWWTQYPSHMYFWFIRNSADFDGIWNNIPYISSDFIHKTGIALAKWSISSIEWPLLYPATDVNYAELWEFIMYGIVPHTFPLWMMYDFELWNLKNVASSLPWRDVFVWKNNFFKGERTHIFWGKDISATTGNITSGNFKGYIVWTLDTWETVKIPYYWK